MKPRVWVRLVDIFPTLPGAEFFADEEKSIWSPDRAALLAYDDTKKTAIVFYVDVGQWLFLTPISFTEFALYSYDQGLLLKDSADTLRWAKSCAGQTSIGSRH